MLELSTLRDFKNHIDTAFEKCLQTLRASDSVRLVDNKISCFMIAVADKLVSIGAAGLCSGCGKSKPLDPNPSKNNPLRQSHIQTADAQIRGKITEVKNSVSDV